MKDLFSLTQTPKGKKPVVEYEVDKDNPLSKHLVIAYDFSINGVHDCINNLKTPTIGGTPPVYTKDKYVSVGSEAIQISKEIRPMDALNSTIVSCFNISSITDWGEIVVAVTGDNNERLAIGKDASGKIFAQYAATWGVTHNLDFPLDLETTAVGVFTESTVGIHFKNSTGYHKDVAVTSQTVATDVNYYKLMIGASVVSPSGRNATGSFGLQLLFDKALSDAEVKTVLDNPYSLFKPVSLEDAVYAILQIDTPETTIAAHVMHYFKQMRQ